MNGAGFITLLVLAGAAFALVLTWLLHRHRHLWTLHSHTMGPGWAGATAFAVTVCLECDLCGERLYLHRSGAEKESGILFHSREGVLVWLRAPRASKVSDHLRESREATNPPGSVA